MNGEITFCNRAAYEVLKRLGLAEDASVFIPPDLNNVLKAGALDSRLYREVRIGGRVFAENIHMATRGRTLRIYAHDITEQVRATEELKGSEERYRHLVELSPDLVAVHSEGTILYINPAGAKLLRANSPDRVIGRPILDIVHPEYRKTVTEQMRQLREEGTQTPVIEMEVLRFDGQAIDVEVEGVPISYFGKPAEQIIIRDITHRQRTEEELERNRELLERLVEERTTELIAANQHLRDEVVERMRAEDQLRKSVETIHDLYNNAPCGYHSLEGEGVIVRINDTELKWLGYTPEEVAGKAKFTNMHTASSAKTFQKTFPRFKKRGHVSETAII